MLGKPMIYWVYKAARACLKLDDVLIATDDERIADACKTYDMRYIMTSPDHDTPTGRIWEVSTVEDADLYLQLMGDEPLVNPAAFDLILPDTPARRPLLRRSADERYGAPRRRHRLLEPKGRDERRTGDPADLRSPIPTRRARWISSTRRSPAFSCTASRH